MPKGGARTGAGRKENSNRYREKTKPLRIPLSLVPTVTQLLDEKSKQSLTSLISLGSNLDSLYTHRSKTPFYTPFYQRPQTKNLNQTEIPSLDINQELGCQSQTVFIFRMKGDDLKTEGLHDGDLLIVDRAKRVKNKSLIIASLQDELSIKTYIKNIDGSIILQDDSKSITILKNDNFHIWGVVSYTIHGRH